MAALLALVLMFAGGMLALVILGQALGTSRYVDWRSMPVVWLVEIGLAVACGALAVAAMIELSRRLDDRSVTAGVVLLEAGAGFVLLAAVTIAAGWVGLQVPTTVGYDVLERGEPVLIIVGVVAGGFGVLVMLVATIAEALGSSR